MFSRLVARQPAPCCQHGTAFRDYQRKPSANRVTVCSRIGQRTPNIPRGVALSTADIAVYRFIEFLLRPTTRPDVRALNLGFDGFGKRCRALDNTRRRLTALPE